MSHQGFIEGGGGGGGVLDRIIDIVGDVLPPIIDRALPGGGRPAGRPPAPTLPQPTNGGGTRAPGAVFRTRSTACGDKSMAPTQAANGMLCCPSGWHLSVAKDRCSGQQTACCVKNRRMNALNFRALSRANRRLTAYNKINARIQKSMRNFCTPTQRRRAPAKPCK